MQHNTDHFWLVLQHQGIKLLRFNAAYFLLTAYVWSTHIFAREEDTN